MIQRSVSTKTTGLGCETKKLVYKVHDLHRCSRYNSKTLKNVNDSMTFTRCAFRPWLSQRPNHLVKRSARGMTCSTGSTTFALPGNSGRTQAVLSSAPEDQSFRPLLLDSSRRVLKQLYLQPILTLKS